MATLRWRPLAELYGKTPDAIAIVECCPEGRHQRRHADVIVARVPDELQRPPRNQPPFRYRCIDCGPTQEDFHAAPDRGAHRAVSAAGA